MCPKYPDTLLAATPNHTSQSITKPCTKETDKKNSAKEHEEHLPTPRYPVGPIGPDAQVPQILGDKVLDKSKVLGSTDSKASHCQCSVVVCKEEAAWTQMPLVTDS